jgi:hypothetical protein
MGKTGLESLWRPRGASAHNANESTSKGAQSQHGRRARRTSMTGSKVAVLSRAPSSEAPEIQDEPAPEPELQERPERPQRPAIPEIQDEPAPEPELDTPGHPDPDVPEPDVPEPEIPEPDVPEPAKPPPEPPWMS